MKFKKQTAQDVEVASILKKSKLRKIWKLQFRNWTRNLIANVTNRTERIVYLGYRANFLFYGSL